MKTINALIVDDEPLAVDDEPLARERLATLLQPLEDLEVVGRCRSSSS